MMMITEKEEEEKSTVFKQKFTLTLLVSRTLSPAAKAAEQYGSI